MGLPTDLNIKEGSIYQKDRIHVHAGTRVLGNRHTMTNFACLFKMTWYMFPGDVFIFYSIIFLFFYAKNCGGSSHLKNDRTVRGAAAL